MTILSAITAANHGFTKGQKKVVRELLADYPIAALSTVASLAERANVSATTVIRLTQKLGFEGFDEFQKNVIEELSDKFKSPLTMMEDRRKLIQNLDLYSQYLRSINESIDAMQNQLIHDECEQACTLMTNQRNRILTLGGRFSLSLAQILANHLQQLRKNVFCLASPSNNLYDNLVDITKNDIIVVYDFRRYQTDVINFCAQAATANATIILFTDPYRSPIEKFSDYVFITPVETISPFDSMASSVALTETFIARITGMMADTSKKRIARLEFIRKKNEVTFSSGSDT